jgi:hypothetical protein
MGAQVCTGGAYGTCICDGSSDSGTPDGSPDDTATPVDTGSPGDTGTPTDTGTPPDGCTPATETCNGVDDDCDGTIDEGCGTGSVAELTAGYDTTCAVRTDGRIFCWGAGHGMAPVEVVSSRDATHVAVGEAHACASRSTGGVICWGSDEFNQIEAGSARMDSASAISIGSFTDAIGVVAARRHSCALLSTGRVWCWGYDRQGQVGDGSASSSFTPTETPGEVTTVTGAIALDGDGSHTCALDSGGTVRCWGNWDTGSAYSAVPLPVVSLSDATTIASGRFGYTANCAIRATGTIACWANPTLGAVPSTAIVPNVAQVDMGTAHACALDDAGAVFCWGANTRGQLGDGTNTPRDDAEAVSGIEAVSVTAGSAHTCALSVSGDVLCWGANTAGQLGNGSTVDSSIPVMVTLPS